MSGEKTEKPTEQRKKEAQKEGNVPRTPDLGSWTGLLLASFLLPMTARGAVEAAQRLLVQAGKIIEDPAVEPAQALLKTGLLDGAKVVAPLAVAMFLVAIVAAAAQGGLRPATKKFKPNFKHLNPFSGLKRIFGGQAVWEGFKALLKTIVIGVVVYYSVRRLVPVMLTAGNLPFEAVISTVASTMLNVLRIAAAAGLVLAAGDYAMAYRRVMKQIKMSKQDVKDEHKKSEGDPHVKGQIRQRQMEMSRNRMMADVPKADVVLVNPTHVAVALRYDPTKGAPRVVAKGAGGIATKIRDLATEHRVPMVQDVPLARALYAGCEIGDEIPPEFYAMVARVLAFIMMLKTKGSAAGVHRSPAGAAA